MPFKQGHALVIGVGTHQYHPGLDVPITVVDAEEVANVLRDSNACGYPPEQVQPLHKSAATKAGILSALEDLAARVNAGDTVFLFYCGHGALGTDGNYYLVSHDARIQGGRVVAGTGVSEGELLGRLRDIQAERMLMVFNACHSGNISPTLEVGQEALASSNPGEDAAAALLGTGQGRIIIAACREQQVSYIGSGPLTIFTQALVDGLRGRGVRNSNGFISAFSLYEHVYESVSEVVQTQFGAVQEPELTVLRGVGPFAVSLCRGASTLGDFAGDEPLPAGMAVREVRTETSARRFEQHVNTGGGAYVGGSVHAGGNFVGRDQIIHGDQVRGDKVGGDKINVGDIQGTGIAVGRGAQAQVQQGISAAELDRLFAPLVALTRDLPSDQREPAEQKVQELKQEAGKGKAADDSRLAKLIDGVIALVPAAVSTVVSMFATPILGGLAGPVTKFALDRIQGK
jgi:hypothetical protein